MLLARFVLAGSGTVPAAPPDAVRGRDGAATAAALEAQLRDDPDSPELLTRLGVTYLTRARETVDPGYFTRAATALDRSRSIEADRPATLTGLGLLALARHDFVVALDLGRRAHELDPASPDPLGIVVDAHVELGQYEEAAAAAQEMVDRRPSLASLSRVSYLRELNGDVAGAITAMTQAALAGAASPSDAAFVEGLLGDLYLGRGDLDKAEAAYLRSNGEVAGFGPAEIGLARVSAARGDLGATVSRLEALVTRLPQPASVALLGDAYAAAGRTSDAAAQYELVRQIEALNRASGVSVDLELARFEADHARDPGARPEAAVELARVALEARPTVFASDALAWSLYQSGRSADALPHAQQAVRLGTADGLLWYHLAAIEADLAMTDLARRHLGQALMMSPYLTVRDLPMAQSLADRLAVAVR